jgi:RHS repeat-associated protein
LGNIREVWRAGYTTSGGTYVAASTVQRTQYYPTGLPWASNSGDNPSTQTKKYNGKEFLEMHGLDEYDSEARMYYPAVGRTTTPDPHSESYYSVSPYAWCANNFVKFVINPLTIETFFLSLFVLSD